MAVRLQRLAIVTLAAAVAAAGPRSGDTKHDSRLYDGVHDVPPVFRVILISIIFFNLHILKSPFVF